MATQLDTVTLSILQDAWRFWKQAFKEDARAKMEEFENKKIESEDGKKYIYCGFHPNYADYIELQLEKIGIELSEDNVYKRQ